MKLGNMYQLSSRTEYAEVIRDVLELRKNTPLSPAAFEVLAVIAYNQPVTKSFIEQIRGVDSSYSISALMNKKLIEECGRLNVPGRPIQYRTTPDFLRTFALNSLEDLPEIEKVSLGEPVFEDNTDQQMQIEEGS